MKATGIVRRIDALGRIVLPIETRRLLEIVPGDPLEMFAGDDDTIIFKRFDPMSKRSISADAFTESMDKISAAVENCKSMEDVMKIREAVTAVRSGLDV